MTNGAWFRNSAVALLAVAACGCLRAADDAAVQAHELVETFSFDLLTGRWDKLLALLDPNMPGYKGLAQDLQLLLKRSLAPSTIAFVSNTGDDKARDLELDWTMQIKSYSGEISTNRRAKVKMRVEKRDGGWRVVQFSPQNFFAPPHMGAVWDVIADALGALAEGTWDERDSAARIPARFLSVFDPKSAIYDTLKTNVTALLQQGHVNSSVVLLEDEGDERQRTVELDWSLSVVRKETNIQLAHRDGHITLRLERRARKWLVVSLDPMTFLAPDPSAK